MHDEYELKLALSPKDLGRLRRSPLVRSLAYRRATSKSLVNIYFDTPERLLERQRMALRIRFIGDRRIQTLKAPALMNGHGHGSGMHHRREFECEVDGELPDLTLVDDAALRAWFTAEQVAENLVPIFETRFQRKSIPLRLYDSEVELSLDEGEIVSGERSVPISEAELELVSGRPARIIELALALHEKVPFHLEGRAKSARGYGLAVTEVPAPARARSVVLSSDMTAAEAFTAVVAGCVGQIRANEGAVQAGQDPEGVHQFRIGVRRLRAAVSVFKPILAPDAVRYLREELRWLQRQFGPARDWDVFIGETLGTVAARLPEEASLSLLGREAEALRQAGYERARSALLDRRYTRLLLRLDLWRGDGGWLNRPEPGTVDPAHQAVDGLADASLSKADRKLRRLAGKHKKLSEPDLHGVRILVKKMRYSVEFFRGLHGKKAVKASLTALQGIQGVLGSLNDAVVGESLLREFLEAQKRRGGGDPVTAQVAAGVIRGWQAARIESDLVRFADSWDSYRHAGRFWR